MALYTDLIKHASNGKYMLVFVNQQYDFLMTIYYDEASASYKLDVSEEEAKRIAKVEANAEFNVEEWLKMAEERCTRADREGHK